MLPLDTLLRQARATGLAEREDAMRLARWAWDEMPALCAAASEVRDRAWGRTLTYSRKVFLPVTNLCRDRCGYCTFRKSPGAPGQWTMLPDEIEAALEAGARAGCKEALLCLGDRPETAYPPYQELLLRLGHETTVDYLVRISERALEHGLLAHTNAGVLTREEMARLKGVNASLGLMLESASARLMLPGMPHHAAPDKAPAVRLRMMREAGELRIPFTTGILVGIGETLEERVESLLAIRDVHAAHGHIQEVIVQPFRAKPETRMAEAAEPEDREHLHAVAMARLLLPPEVSVQLPPNLSPGALRAAIRAGINDFGGISPVTRDYINPEAPWPHVERLGELCAAEDFTLRERLAVYPRYVDQPGFLAERVQRRVHALRAAVA